MQSVFKFILTLEQNVCYTSQSITEMTGVVYMFLLLLSVVLLVASFMIQKLYQKKTEGIDGSDVKFNIYTAVFSLCVFAFSGGFKIEFSTFSLINATLKAACGLFYMLIGFKILAMGNVALYMLFLMSGGMAVPCVFGWLFLGEEASAGNVIGVIIILISVILSNSGATRPDKKVLLMCIAVFFLNGFVSIFSKLHQIGGEYGAVNTSSYALISTVASFLMSSALLFRKKGEKTEKEKKKFSFLPILLVIAYSVVGSVASLMQLEGAKELPASVLYPVVTGGSIALSGVFGLLFFGEKLSRRAWLGIALCFAGTCFFI